MNFKEALVAKAAQQDDPIPAQPAKILGYKATNNRNMGYQWEKDILRPNFAGIYKARSEEEAVVIQSLVDAGILVAIKE